MPQDGRPATSRRLSPTRTACACCLKLVHATLIRAANNGQRVGITATERAQLNLLYQELEIQPVNEISAVA